MGLRKHVFLFFALFWLVSITVGVRIGGFEKGIDGLSDYNARPFGDESQDFDGFFIGEDEKAGSVGLSTTVTQNGEENPSSAVLDFEPASGNVFEALHCEPDPVTNDNNCDGHAEETNSVIILNENISLMKEVETGFATLSSPGEGSSSAEIMFETSYTSKPHLFFAINDYDAIRESDDFQIDDFGKGHSLRVVGWVMEDGEYVGAEVKHCQQNGFEDSCESYPDGFESELRYAVFDSEKDFRNDERFSGSSSLALGRATAPSNANWGSIDIPGTGYTPAVALNIGHDSGSGGQDAVYSEINSLGTDGFDFRVCEAYGGDDPENGCDSHNEEPVSYIAALHESPSPDYLAPDIFQMEGLNYDLPPEIKSVKYRGKELLGSSDENPVTFDGYNVRLNVSYRDYEGDTATFDVQKDVEGATGSGWEMVPEDYSVGLPSDSGDYGGTGSKGWRIIEVDFSGGTGSDVVSEDGTVYRWDFDYGERTGSEFDDVRRNLDGHGSWESFLEFDSVELEDFYFDFSVPPSVSCDSEFGCHECAEPDCRPFEPGDRLVFRADAQDDNNVESMKFCRTELCDDVLCTADMPDSTSVTGECTAEIDEGWNSFQNYYVVVEDGAGNSASILGGSINVMSKVFSTERDPRVNVSFSTDDYINLFVSNQESNSKEYRIETRPSMQEGRVDVSFDEGFVTDEGYRHVEVSSRSSRSLRANFRAIACSDVCSGTVDIVLTDIGTGNTYTETVPVTIRSYSESPAESGGVLSGSAPGITSFQILFLVLSISVFSVFYRF